MSEELLAAIALVLIIEGLLPGLFPGAWRRFLLEVSRFSDRHLRIAGIASMVVGALLLKAV